MTLLFSMTLYADLLADGNREAKKKNYKKAFELYTKACSGGSSVACSNLGYYYKKGKGVKKNHDKSVKYYTIAHKLAKESCDNAITQICHNLAYTYKYGNTAVPKDLDKFSKYALKAANLYAKGCDDGDAEQCYQAALLFGNIKDEKKAYIYKKKACDSGDYESCAGVAFAYSVGKGIRKSMTEAIKYATISCDNGGAYGCNVLAGLYEKQRDYIKAAHYYEKAIAGGYDSFFILGLSDGR